MLRFSLLLQESKFNKNVPIWNSDIKQRNPLFNMKLNPDYWGLKAIFWKWEEAIKKKNFFKPSRFSLDQNLPSFNEPFVTFWWGNTVFDEIDMPWKNFELRSFTCKIWCLSGTHSSFFPRHTSKIYLRRRALHVSGSFRRTHLHFLKKMAAQT